MPDFEKDTIRLGLSVSNPDTRPSTAQAPDAGVSTATDAPTAPTSSNARLSLSHLVDLVQIQRMAEAYYRVSGMPMGIVDSMDGSILVSVGGQNICSQFHRLHPATAQHCKASEKLIQEHIVEGECYENKCNNGLLEIGIPITIPEQQLATLYLGPFLYKEEPLDFHAYTERAQKFGFDPEGYRVALGNVPLFSKETVDSILVYNKAFILFIETFSVKSVHLRAEIARAKQTRSALEKDKALVECLIDAFPNPMCFKSMDGKYQNCNKALASLLGKEKSDIIGKTVFEMTEHELATRHHEMDQILCRRPGIRIYESKLIDGEGNLRFFLFTKFIFSDGEKPINLVCIMTDITHRKRLQGILRLSHEEMEWFFNATHGDPPG